MQQNVLEIAIVSLLILASIWLLLALFGLLGIRSKGEPMQRIREEVLEAKYM